MDQFAIALLISAIITYFLRALPFIFFARKPMPAWLSRLGESLPSAVMACLIVYCLSDLNFTNGIAGIAGILAAIFTVIVYMLSKSMFVSMLLATGCYMILLNL